ncbi:TGFBI [Branchiostoma lanceolatum]|uniref:TGFBI protein n=1 Tax=Branchiostoma lanceolatum TaxID=7740 RepID=A0A8K0EYX7_BRALA|nr:TGFBI [Branchiostoma lanceolatum]
MKFLLVLLPLLCAVSAKENVLDVMRSLQLRSLVQLLEVADLSPTLENADSCTVFAPSDAAFAKIPPGIRKQLLSNQLLLREVLAFHASPKEYMSTDLKNNQLVETLLKGFIMRINIYPSTNTITADGSPVSKPDNKASNGVVHVVDQVLYPFPTGTVDAEINHNDNLSVLNEAVEKAGLGSALDGDGPFTLFAPTNDAFMKLPNGTLPSLLKNVTALTEILTYHVVSGVYYKAGLSDGEELTTLQKGKLVCHVNAEPGSDPQVTVNNAKTVGLPIPAVNGVNDVVDVMNNLGLRTMVQLLGVADLIPTLQARDSCTVFAPSDDAFNKLPAGIKQQLLSNQLLLRETITADGSPVSKPDNRASNGVVHVVDQVLYPFPSGTVDAEISHNDNLSVLNEAVDKAGLGSALDGDGPFTLFAPTNDAFKKLPNGTLPSLLKNVTALTEILTYHVVSGVYYKAGLSDGEELTTLQKGKLVCHVNAEPGSDPQVTVNNAKTVGLAIPAVNGVVQMIDTVLLPPK